MSTDPPAASTFPPLGNEFVVGVASAPLFSPQEAQRIAGLISDTGLVRELADQLQPALAAAVSTANSQYFRFELRTLDDLGDETVLATVVPTVVPGLCREHQLRKLTVVLALDADPAASLTFPMIDRQVVLEPGTVTMFPAYLYCRLDPGASFSGLLAFAQGPAFR